MKILAATFAVLLFAVQINAKPSKDKIIFRDQDESGDFLGLEDENQILPSVGGKLDIDEKEQNLQHLEHGSFFQGDIILDEAQKEYLLVNESDSSLPTRTGWIDEAYRWPKDKQGNAILTYYISPKSQYSNYQKTLMRSAMDDIEQFTCVRFRERSNEDDFIYIYSGSGCHSHMGRIGGQQEFSIRKSGCSSRGIIIHELIHALGYDHMHSHSDRNNFIDIKWENIETSAISNFDRVDPEKLSNFGTKYDLYSVMHYDKTAFSKNGQDTIVPKNRRYKNIIGQRRGLSKGDAKRINNMYKCKE